MTHTCEARAPHVRSLRATVRQAHGQDRLLYVRLSFTCRKLWCDLVACELAGGGVRPGVRGAARCAAGA